MGVIHLIRHGRPVLTGVLLGSSDVPLLAGDIAPSRLAVERVYASPLARALRTAELLFPNAAMVVVPELAERGLGEWELKRWAEVEAEWPELAARASADWFATTPPGGEAWGEFAARVERGWLGIDRVQSCAIVAHAGVNAVDRKSVV